METTEKVGIEALSLQDLQKMNTCYIFWFYGFILDGYGDFILDINLSTTEKKYKEICNEFITRVVDDLSLIKTNEFEAEILVEYKKTLNASKSITDVQVRKQKEKEEAEKLKIQSLNNRISFLEKEGFIFDNFTKVYSFNQDIYIKESDVKELSKELFQTEYLKLIEKVKEFKLKQLESQKATEQSNPEQPFEVVAIVSAPEILEAPKVEIKEEILTATFEIKGTISQLKGLQSYILLNKLTYKNIE